MREARESARGDSVVKQSVALLVYPPGARDRFVVVRRPEHAGEELAGLWGLPAATLRPGEEETEAAHRIAREKLGTTVRLMGVRARGIQERPGYRLEMRLYEAELIGPEPRLPPPPPDPKITYYTAWRWADAAALREAAQQGSLCARLALEALGPYSSTGSNMSTE
ncbi:MAG: NUDIX hydrolase [Armatimonadetes bacterium]|nr:NUDIX hydrolase [Armatimonadota bacterium]MDW8154759.1 NUDIX hydrolase [Armatimonadota bacterium]